MAAHKKPEPEEAAATFDHDICLYSSAGAKVFRKGEPIPPESEGWRDHPSLVEED